MATGSESWKSETEFRRIRISEVLPLGDVMQLLQDVVLEMKIQNKKGRLLFFTSF